MFARHSAYLACTLGVLLAGLEGCGDGAAGAADAQSPLAPQGVEGVTAGADGGGLSTPQDGGVSSPRDGATGAFDGGASAGPTVVSDAAPAPGSDAAPLPTTDAGPSSVSPDASLSDSDSGPPQTSSADQTIMPHASWTCGMADGIPPPELGTLAFTAEFSVTAKHDMGATQYGQRSVLEFGEGKISGPKLSASLTSGGFELLAVLAGGSVELEQVLVLEASDSAPIYLRVCGVSPNETDAVRVVMDFEAPTSGHGELNSLSLVGVRELSSDGKQLTLKVYDVSDVTLPSDSVAIQKDGSAPTQTWECKTASGQNGAEVYRETVQIGGSVLVGDSKRGVRNIIPITGGTTSGRIKGSVLPLGGDFQLLGGDFVIDARYILSTQDQELIIVRNCGPLGALVPVFETRADGPYAWVNENHWLSSDPSVGLGNVSLTIYEQR